MVVGIFRYFVGLGVLMAQRYGIYLTLPNVLAKKTKNGFHPNGIENRCAEKYENIFVRTSFLNVNDHIMGR